ncbi:hypothetical protein PVAND_016110 [Polypedilum vanderplanki]|uniref:Uncharacterized protein n=1 Tax=Polypedilum vanderplanki TaxID=319348 RepID=A0A9J6BF75_POLVA|nr:hypothetical protein PVAND_016110 [Polypedilum vanderplanki]
MTEVKKSSSISPHDYFKKIISNSSEPLIGLEYIILFPYPNLTIKPFHCVLCDKAYDESLINIHLISNLHRRNYLIFNFPTLLKYLQSKQSFQIYDFNKSEIIFTKIAQNLQPFLSQVQSPIVDFIEFKENRPKIIQEMKKESKFLSEKNLKDFMKILLKKIEDFNEEIDLDFDENFDVHNFECIGYDFHKIKDYNSRIISMENNINILYKIYRNFPQLHPEFIRSWKIFNDCKEKIVKIRRNETDLLPYWRKFWLVRMEEIKQQEIFDKKKEIKHEIDLRNSDLYEYEEKNLTKVFKPPEIENHQFKADGDSDSDYGKEYAESCIRGPNYKPRRRKRHCLVTEMHQKSDDELFKPDNFKFDSPGTLFSLIRHLIAIEKELGCIVNGIKKFYIISAEMEKEKPFSSETLLNDSENFITFKIICLKLRSVIEQKKFDDWKMRGVQRVLQQLNAMLVQVAYRNKKLNEEFQKLIEFVNFPCVKENEKNEYEDIEIAKIVTQFLCEQENNFDNETLEIVVKTIKNELV